MAMTSRIPALLFCVTGWLIAMVALTGCRMAESAARMPGQVVTSVSPGGRTQKQDPAALQVELQRFADEFAGRTVAALEDYARLAGTDEARRQVLHWKISVGAAAVTIATGPNPQANLLDFVALASATRTALERVQGTNAAAIEPWLEVSRSLEASAWSLAAGVFSAEQIQEIRDAMRRWWESNPEGHMTFFARPEEFSSLIRKSGQEGTRPGSVFAMVGLDPTAGLDPAVREVTRTRLFAERAMYLVQRMPFLVRWHVELLTDELLHQEQIAGVLTNTASLVESTDRISRATELASATAAQLPDRVTAERQAIIASFESQEGKLRELSAEATRTLEAGEKMSASLNTTLTTFDALMHRFGAGESVAADAPDEMDATPFSILDYARTAEQIAAMAQQLDILIKDTGSMLDSPALDRRIGELNTLSERARADAKSVLNHAFLLAAGLILLVLVCGLVYRGGRRGVQGLRG
jgi:hypothetical protein